METLKHLLVLFEFQPGWKNTIGGLGLLLFFFVIYELWRHALMVEHTTSRFWHVVITSMVVFPSIVVFAIMIYADVKNHSPWRNFGIAVVAISSRNFAAILPRLVRYDWEGKPIGFSAMWLLMMLLATIIVSFIL